MMAEACRLGIQQKTERDSSFKQDENFCVFNVLCVFISLVTILADITTDILVFAEYCQDGHIYWATATLILILAPNILINVFSLRWYIIDQKCNLKQWIFHGCLIGFLERYVLFLHKIFACPNLDTQKLISQRNDLNLLHFLYIFTGTIPQIILQTYAIITLEENFHTKAFALTASNASVIWGCASYIYSIMVYCNDNFQWVSLAMRLLWHFAMLIARLSAILLFTVIFGVWTLLPLCLHWTAMTFWIIVQNTTFCPNKIEETLYNLVMGFVYCFCYINLRDGHTRYRLMMFYTLMVSQNFGSLFLYYVIITDLRQQRNYWSIVATICIIAGTFTGIIAMILYYRYFHSKGPITWKYPQEDIELNNKSTSSTKENKNNDLRHVRSFKSSNKVQVETKNSKCEDIKVDQSVPPNESETADKKFLLDHWIARSGSPTFTSAPIGNASMDVSSIVLYTVENTPQSMTCNSMNKKVTICSPTELNLKLSSLDNIESSIDEITSSNLNLQKRRGICSSDELRDDIVNLSLDTCNIISESFDKTLKTDFHSITSHDTDGSNKKTSSDSIDMDLDLSFSDINSSDINTFNENIVQKLCLSALKNIKVGNQDADIENIQRIALDILKEMYTKKDKSKNGFKSNSLTNKQRDVDTPTEILSVHDYENICAVNIAREAWGLRSWNGYCDIENWLHDGSVVRDRRRDTLTSASTEISSCISQDLKQAIMAAPSFPKKAHTYSNVFIKSNQEDYANATSCLSSEETFLAKPCLIDGKDLSHLEPILEELDDLGDVDPANKKRLNSESSLVATIDEIRKATVTNSPRNVYHRREQLWDSPQFSESSKIHSNLKRALWKEPSKFDSSNTLESLPEKENIVNLQGSKYDMSKKELYFSSGCETLDLDNPESASIYSKNTRRRRSNSNVATLKPDPNNDNINSEHNLQDLSNHEIDFLWQLVSENTLPLSSSEYLSSNRRTSSMQSLIHKETSNASVSNSQGKVTNLKKSGKSRPRRKFSILRERFEPKANINSDKEVLYQHSENTLTTPGFNVVNLKNEINTKEKSASIDQHQIDFINSTDSDSRVTQSNLGKNIKEKRTLFMKQVLNPPKFNTKLKHKF